MSGWMTIRVTVTSGGGHELGQPPARIMLVHLEHGLDELAEAVNLAFARWDTAHAHSFEFPERRYMQAGVEPAEDGWEPSDEAGIGDLDLQAGDTFVYTFDFGENWRHECVVEDLDVDPEELYGMEPEVPVPVWGWGMIPDQYWRVTDEDPAELDDDPLDEAADLESWTAPEEEAWDIVAATLQPSEKAPDAAGLAASVKRLRYRRDDGAVALLWSIAGEPDPATEDEQLWLALAGAVVTPQRTPQIDPDRNAAWGALEPADWAAAVIELVRAGVGSPADPEALLRHIRACPEVEDEQELSEEDEQVLLDGLGVVTELLAILGAIDEAQRLTRLGLWGLPLALRTAWLGEPVPAGTDPSAPG